MKKPLIIKSLSLIFLLLASAAVLAPTLVLGQGASLNTPAGGYQLPKATVATPTQVIYATLDFVDGSQECRVISTTTQTTYFIPTKFPTLEWSDAFLSHYPNQTIPACCGDGYCKATGMGVYVETVSNCPEDCQVGYCGNSICDAGETISSCSFDCTFGACLLNGDEVAWQSTCTTFITSGSCDPVHCVWSGSFCSAKIMPEAATCNVIQASATCNGTYGCVWCSGCHRNYLWCGDDICSAGINEDVTSCPQDCGGAYCGNGTCGSGENCANCSEDCGGCSAYCGNAICEWSEDCCTCRADCLSCPESCQGPAGCEVVNKETICNNYGDCYWAAQQCN